MGKRVDPSSTSGTLRILLVEDDPNEATFLVSFLRVQGLLVDVTRVDDEEALRAALREPAWAAILVDGYLPRLQAHRALELARELSPGTPCLLWSGKLQFHDEAGVLADADFLPKGSWGELAAWLERHLPGERAGAPGGDAATPGPAPRSPSSR